MYIPKQRSVCPLSMTLDMFGDKWSLLILRDAILLDKRRYGEFLGSPENISTNILANRLKQLEHSGFLEKFSDPTDGKVSLYIPTERGVSLLPLMIEAMRWGRAECEQSGVPDFVVELLAHGTGDFIHDKSAALANERSALSRSC